MKEKIYPRTSDKQTVYLKSIDNIGRKQRKVER